MTLARLRCLLLAASVMAMCSMLASCSNDSHQSAPVTSRSRSNAQPTQRPATARPGSVIGTVFWPDGVPAAGVPLVFYPQGYSAELDTTYDPFTTDGQGNYILADCPCNGVVGFVDIPASTSDPNVGPFDGGRDCWLLMQPAGRAEASGSGVRLNWQIFDMPCDSSYFDPAQLQSVVSELSQQAAEPANSQDFGYAGTWQDARQRRT